MPVPAVHLKDLKKTERVKYPDGNAAMICVLYLGECMKRYRERISKPRLASQIMPQRGNVASNVSVWNVRLGLLVVQTWSKIVMLQSILQTTSEVLTA